MTPCECVCVYKCVCISVLERVQDQHPQTLEEKKTLWEETRQSKVDMEKSFTEN